MTESNSESVTEREDFSFEKGSLEPSVEELAAALAHSDQSVVVTSLAGKVRYVNPAFQTLTGFSSVEVIGKKPSLWKSGYHSVEFYTDMWRALQLGKSWQGEVVNKKKSGELYFSDLTISPLKNSLGQISGYVGFHHDITKRKRLSQELSKANASLLALSKEQALFFARLSHDMRTPLASIIGICELEPTPEMIQ